MGSVWLAQHLTLDCPVAIKLIDPQIAAESEVLERFMREAQAAAALRSPHVVQILDYGLHQRTPYIAMELLEGESLAQRLSRVRCLSPAETATTLTHIARAVAKAHDLGIVHRDLKPENVFLVRNDDEELAKVLDFGIAKRRMGALGPDASGAATSQTRTGALLGTPYYMSPEQAEGAKTIDYRTDLWAMGVIAFECLLGERPFKGSSIGELVLKICSKPMPVPSACGSVPAGFDAWFSKACARELEQRFKSVRELVGAFRSLTLGSDAEWGDAEGALSAAPPRRPATTTSVPVFRSETPPARRARPVLSIGLAAAGIVLAGVGGALWFADGGSVPAKATSLPERASATQPIPAGPKVEHVTEAPSPGPSVVPQAIEAAPGERESAPEAGPRVSSPTRSRTPRPSVAAAPRGPAAAPSVAPASDTPASVAPAEPP
ncbi:MAG TPA: protein kinase, partial [Polyangiaceae bacterium]